MQAESDSHRHAIKVWFAAILVVVLATGRGDLAQLPLLSGFGWFIGLYLVAFAAYFWVLRSPDDERLFKHAIVFGILARLVLVFSFPNLSDDFYRYIWDGRLWLEGQNPMDTLPSQWMMSLGRESAEEWQYLYDHLNSKEYHTVYPLALQVPFAFAAMFSDGDVYLAVVLLKVWIFLAEVGSIWLLTKIVKRFQLPFKSVLVYVLNPLVLVELSGNAHFEAFMIFFFLAGIWFLMKWGILPAAPLLAVAIASKLLPVLVFPFLLRRMGWGRTIALGVLTVACCLPLFWWMVSGGRWEHFRDSLTLYFHSFEFNGGVYYVFRWILGFWANRILPWVMVAVLLVSAWRERNRVWKGLPAAMMLALTLYQLHSPVLHPWYIAPIVAMAALGPYRYPVFWTLLLPFTYAAYFRSDGIHEYSWVLAGEYCLLFGFMAYEWIFRRQRLTLTEWMLRSPWRKRQAQRSIPARLKIKQARIAKHLAQDGKILDIGAGNAGLCRALRQEGWDVHPIDVADLSFFPEVKAEIYDGKTIPYADKTFDTALMITMLHHTPEPEKIIREAMRVTKRRLVIMEDIYRSEAQKQLTYFTDSLVNLEFEDHPHTNKTDAAWLALFQGLGLKLVHREQFRTLLFFTQVIYVLELE